MFRRTLLMLLVSCLVSGFSWSSRDWHEPNYMDKKAGYSGFCKDNTVYIIKKNYNFHGKTVVIGKGSTLSFRGGSFKNAIIKGNDSYILDNGHAEFLRNCTIEGSWKVKIAKSVFFQRTMPAEALLLNLAVLSDTIELSNNRNYIITKNRKCWLHASVLRGYNDEKPTLDFVYDRKVGTNLEGINLIADTVKYESLKIVDHFSPQEYPDNDQTLGSTLYAGTQDHLVNYCEIVDCDFSGGTSSSFFSSSKVRNFFCHNCSFTGYMADHATYCSTYIENYVIDSVVVNNVNHSAGLFKIRDNKPLKNYILRNLSIDNVKGYVSIVSLNPEQVEENLLFENIIASNINLFSSTTTPEPDIVHNSVTIRNCTLHAVGTDNRMLFNQGNYKPVLWSSIVIENSDIRNFFPPWENSCIDLYVSNCMWQLLDSAKFNQSVTFSKNINIKNTEFYSERTSNIFLYDYKGLLESLVFDNVTFDINSNYLVGFGKDNKVDICFKDSKIEGLKRSLFSGERSFPKSLYFRNINTKCNSFNDGELVYPRKYENNIIFN